MAQFSLLVLSLLAVVGCTEPPKSLVESREFFLNANGPSLQYTIVRYRETGEPASPEPVVVPSGDGFDRQHVAWPSAVSTPAGETLLFASGYNGRRWDGVGLWRRAGSGEFERVGRVVAPEVDESAVSVASVAIDPGAARPFRMWFSVVRDQQLPTELHYADSEDGRTWKRHGVVLRADQRYELAGLAIDYVCQDPLGMWHLFYTAYPSLDASVAAEAISTSPMGPFSKQGVVMTFDGVEARVTHEIEAGDDELVVDGEVHVNSGYVLYSGLQATLEVVSVLHKEGTTIQLATSTEFAHDTGARLVSFSKRKLSPSFVELVDGEWRGVFTGYGGIDKLLMEYTFPVKRLADSWVVDRSRPGPTFAPSIPAARFSLENPEPLRRDSRCVR